MTRVPVSHQFVNAGGLRTHVVTAGDPSAPPMLLLHGWPQTWYAFRHLIPELAKTHHVIAPDLRGWGETDALPWGYEAKDRLADAIAVIEALGLANGPPIRLIGHDWGCHIGFLLCAQRPDLVERFMGLALFHLWPRPGLKQARALARFWYWPLLATPRLGPRAARSNRFRRLIYKRWAASGHEWSDGDFAKLTAHLNEPRRAQATSLSYRAAIKSLLPTVAGRHRSVKVTTPILLLLGAADRCIDPVLAQPTKRAPNMRIEVLPGVGHFIPEEAPDIVLRHARSFFP
jgi:pimeloyl-ACP methyl ester carboxylesterase